MPCCHYVQALYVLYHGAKNTAPWLYFVYEQACILAELNGVSAQWVVLSINVKLDL